VVDLTDRQKWAAETGNPMRADDGTLLVWDQPSEKFVETAGFGMSSLWLGEVGKANVYIRESVVLMNQQLTANGVSNINFEVYDPGFVMHNLGNFILDRTVNFNGWLYTITSVTTHFKTNSNIVKVKAEASNVVKLMHDKGAADFGSISPTAFAAQKAAEMGLRFFGEASVADGPIVRRFDDKTDESTWDVLNAQAQKLKFSLFEGNNILFFATDEYIIANQPQTNIKIPSEAEDGLFVITANTRRSSIDKFSAECDFEFYRNESSTSIFPGVCFTILGLGAMDHHTYMVTNVNFNAKKDGTVKVTSIATEEAVDSFCSNTTIQRGSEGFCVFRMQQAIGMSGGGLTGVYGPVTEQRVKDWQKANGVGQTGVVGPTTWAKIEEVT